jgi:hypothetical protein
MKKWSIPPERKMGMDTNCLKKKELELKGK